MIIKEEYFSFNSVEQAGHLIEKCDAQEEQKTSTTECKT
jgi:hypothetical protein